MPNLRPFGPAFILLLGCGFILRARSQAAVLLAAPLTNVLPSVAGYREQDQQLSAEEQRVAGMTTYIARSYWRDSVLAFTTFVSYYNRQTQGRTIHSPRNCLPGAGWEVLSAATTTITAEGVPHVVNHYVLKNGPAEAVVYYWYQGRGRVVANEYAVKWNLLRDAAVAGHTEEALVRVVAFVEPTGTGPDSGGQRALAAATSLGADVATQLLASVERVLPGSATLANHGD